MTPQRSPSFNEDTVFCFHVPDAGSPSSSRAAITTTSPDPPTPSLAPTTRARSVALSRATTARPKTATLASEVANGQPTWLVALLEARADTRVIGVACLCLELAHIVLCEIQGDSSTYAKTTHALAHRMPADAILLPNTTWNHKVPASQDACMHLDLGEAGVIPGSGSEAILPSVLQEAFPDSELVPVMRKHWNSDNGLELVGALAVDNDDRHALIKAVESK